MDLFLESLLSSRTFWVLLDMINMAQLRQLMNIPNYSGSAPFVLSVLDNAFTGVGHTAEDTIQEMSYAEETVEVNLVN